MFRNNFSKDTLHFGRVGSDCHDQTPFELNESAVHYYFMVILAQRNDLAWWFGQVEFNHEGPLIDFIFLVPFYCDASIGSVWVFV